MSQQAAAKVLPTLDISRFDAGGDERGAFLVDLRAAARNFGFFYLVGHGVGRLITQDLFGLGRRFFSLPDADKLAIEMVNSPQFRGYTRVGREYTRGKPDWREQIDIGAERAGAADGRTLEQPLAPASGPNQWPAALPNSSRSLLAYQERVTALAIRVLQAFAAALEQPEDVFAPIYAPAPNQLIKIIRYPGRAAGDGDQGVGAHKDSAASSPSSCRTRSAGLQVEGDGGLDRRAARTRNLHRQHRRNPRNRLQRLFARQRPPRRFAAGGRRPAVDRVLPRRQSRRDVPLLDPAAASGGRGARASRRTRSIRCSAKSAAMLSRAGCARILMSRSAITPTSLIPRSSNPVASAY